MDTLPTTTRAAILVEQRAPLVVDEVSLPEDGPGVGQVLVEVHVSGICGSQLGEIDGVKGPDRFLPHLLGHEGAATVLAVGPGVRTVEVGDLVVLHWRPGAGIRSEVPTYRWGSRPLNAGWVTTFNDHAIVSEDRCTTVSEGTDPRVAALLGCAVTTGFGVVENGARLRMGESMVVLGAGGVGLNVIQAAARIGAHPIVAVDLFDNRLELAGRLGATHLCSGTPEDLEEEIRAVVGGSGADVVVDNTGAPAMIELGYRLAGTSGRLVLVGVPRHDTDVRLHSLPMHFGRRMVGSHGGDGDPTVDIPRYLRIQEAGLLDLQGVVTDVVALEEINGAISAMRCGDVSGRCLVGLETSQA